MTNLPGPTDPSSPETGPVRPVDGRTVPDRSRATSDASNGPQAGAQPIGGLEAPQADADGKSPAGDANGRQAGAQTPLRGQGGGSGSGARSFEGLLADSVGATAVDELYAGIGRRVLSARRARAYSQAELAEAVGLARSSIANIEAGMQRPTVHALVAIAQALVLDPADLMRPERELPPLAGPLAATSPRLAVRLRAARRGIDALLALLPDEPDTDGSQP